MNRLRLLPLVMVLGLALLVLKGTGLVHEAQADATPAAAHTAAPVQDFAGSDDDSQSAAEVDVLASLSKRRTELDKRAKDQEMRANVLAATEKRVDGKIAELKALEARITQLIGQRDAEQDAQVKSLVKTYSAMKPKDAARIFDGLSEDVLVPVAQAMKSDALAPVLAAMNPAQAQKLTVKLASRLALPEKADADPVAPPAPQAQAAPPQDQQAAPLQQQADAAPPAAAPKPEAATPAAAKPKKHAGAAPLKSEQHAAAATPPAALPPQPAAPKPEQHAAALPPAQQQAAAAQPAVSTPAAPQPSDPKPAPAQKNG